MIGAIPIRSTVSRCVETGLEVLLPADCLLCVRPLPWRQRGGVCFPCWDQMLWAPGVRFGCGNLRAIMWAADYEGPIRQLIQQLKFHGLDYLGRPLGEEMARRLGPLCGAGLVERPDAVVPVPLHWWRRIRRGFNQAALLAAGFATPLGFPLLPSALTRRAGGRQIGSTRIERRHALREHFLGHGKPRRHGRAVSLSGRTILLLDDVMTTGATLEACATALRAAGSGPVIGCAVARTLERGAADAMRHRIRH